MAVIELTLRWLHCRRGQIAVELGRLFGPSEAAEALSEGKYRW
jgi:hypothetical protein